MNDYFSTIKHCTSTIDKMKAEIDWWKKKSSASKLSLKDEGKGILLISGARAWIKPLSEIISLLDLLQIEWFDENKKIALSAIEEMQDAFSSRDLKLFEASIELLGRFFEKVSQEISHKVDLLNAEEKLRLNEAINCYLNELNYSSIVMSVSAIESRLYSLMKVNQPNAKLEKLTLGGLITEYLENKSTYNHVIPDKHLPLLQYSNTYRIFSVHPKKEKITRSNTTTILCMTCSFLFDESMKINKDKKN